MFCVPAPQHGVERKHLSCCTKLHRMFFHAEGFHPKAAVVPINQPSTGETSTTGRISEKTVRSLLEFWHDSPMEVSNVGENKNQDPLASWTPGCTESKANLQQ